MKLSVRKPKCVGISHSPLRRHVANAGIQISFQNSDIAAMSYLYDETTRRLERDLRANPDSIRFHLEMAALDDPRAAKFSEKDFWDTSVVEEIRRSGFIDQLYRR